MPVSTVPGRGVFVTGQQSFNFQFPNTASQKFNISPDRGTWQFGTSKAMAGREVPVTIDATVYIMNPDELEMIAEGANLTFNYLARDAANAALDLYETAEQLLADEVKGKIRIEVSPGPEGYLVQAIVVPEPATRRPKSNSTIRVSSSGSLLRAPRYVHARQVGSITTYVAQKMHTSFDEAVPKVEARYSAAVQGHVKAAFRAFGVTVSGGIATVPAGGIEYAGKYYPGGSSISLG